MIYTVYVRSNANCDVFWKLVSSSVVRLTVPFTKKYTVLSDAPRPAKIAPPAVKFAIAEIGSISPFEKLPAPDENGKPVIVANPVAEPLLLRTILQLILT